MTLTRDKTLLLIDSHALIHRAYHAFPPDLRTRDGEVVNAVYGFARLLLEVLAKFKPSHVVALFDSPGKTIRHDQFVGYKANRTSPDDELIQQIPRVEELLANLCIPCLRVDGYEADDLIGTIDARHSGSWAQTVIVTGDRDLFQLVDEDTFVYLAGSQFSKSQLFDADGVKAKMGVAPEFIVDLKGLHGDPSDNIPGVYGIGEKGAVSLISEFGHIEEMFKQIDRIPPKYKTKLTENFDQAELSKKLATIIRDVPISFDFEKEAAFGKFPVNEAKAFFRELQFTSILNSLDKLIADYAALNGISDAGEAHVAMTLELPLSPETKEWDAKFNFETSTLFFEGKLQKTGDPLTWRLDEFYVLYEEQLVRVPVDSLANFFATLKGKRLVGFGVKSYLHALQNMGVDYAGVEFYDLAISTYLLSAGEVKQEPESVCAYYKLALPADMSVCACWKEIYTQQIEQFLKLTDAAKVNTLEQELVNVVATMERNGIILNVEKLAKFAQKIEAAIKEIEAAVYENVGHEFNISSPKQVGEVLFVEKGLPSGKKTKTGGFSTDERTLRDLLGVDPVIQLILDYRELSKLLGTYLSPLPDSVNKQTHRIHATFHQLGAVTGRFSSQYPNLQNIPLGEVAGVNVREAFESAPGTIFVAFDYSQQELRLLAELSGDEVMSEAFRNNEDIHRRTAAEIFDVSIKDVTAEQRKVGKTVNFGIVYGMSGFGLADRLKIDPRKANEFVKVYFQRYPKVKNYYDRLIVDARNAGYVSTILGRRRSTYGLSASNFQLRQATEREVMNYPLQGSAADIIKMGMLQTRELVDKYPAKLILQIHDELVFEYSTELSKDKLAQDPTFVGFVEEVKRALLDVIVLKVPLEVGVEVGSNLGQMEDFVA